MEIHLFFFKFHVIKLDIKFHFNKVTLANEMHLTVLMFCSLGYLFNTRNSVQCDII